MVKSVLIRKTGASSALEFIERDIVDPVDEEVLVRHTFIGLNRYDLEHKNGIRKIKTLPAVLGMEAVGIVEKIGKNVGDFINVGDRVGYCTALPGAYCDKRILHQKYLIKIPEHILDEIAALVLFKGVTAHYLVNHSYKVRPGSVVLVHGANGGLGQILCQWAKSKGGIVIGSVNSDGKAGVALQNGCAHVINYGDNTATDKIMEITSGCGVDVVYDPIGYATSKFSFGALGKFGMYVSYGQISGAAHVSFSLLSSRSLFATGTSIYHYKSDRFTLILTAMEIFEMIRKKILVARVNREYKFDEIHKAHRDMEARKISGLNVIKVE